MTTLSLHATGPASADVAWERYADIAQWPSWSPQIRAVESSAPRIAPGVRGVVRPWVGPGVHFVVVDVDEPARTWTWLVDLGPLRFTLGHGVAEDPRGCRTELTISGAFPLIAAYAPFAQVALLRLVRR